MPGQYAASTDVPVMRSKAAIEALLVQHGATAFHTGWNESHDIIEFTMFARQIRFLLPRPNPKDKRYTHNKNGWLRAPGAIQKTIEQADRQRWRALYLVIRAKIEAVEARISVFESEFLAWIVTPDGMTIGDVLVPRITGGEVLRLPGAVAS